ncbi:MAG: EF-hand domain-containing protein [Akkermansia sp.]
MNKKTLPLLILLALAPCCWAQDGSKLAELRQAKLKAATAERFDKNNDGSVGKKEATAAKTHHGKVVNNFDKNNDGSLGKKERGAAASSQGKGKSTSRRLVHRSVNKVRSFPR